MSYVSPIVPTFTGLRNIERVVQLMQTHVASELAWLDYSFGMAERMVSQGEEPYIFPATFMTDHDYYDCLPNDKHCFSFWRINDPSDMVNYDEDEYNKVPLIETDIDFIVFADLRKIDNLQSYYVTRSQMRQDVINALNKMQGNFKLVPRTIFENDMTEIYSGYSIEQIENIKKQFPFWAIRVNCTVKYVADCDENVYELIPSLDDDLIECLEGFEDNFQFLWAGRYDTGALVCELTGEEIAISSRDWLTSSIPSTAATFTAPASLQAADTDNFWFVGGVPVAKTFNQLITSTTLRTFVKYTDFAPYTISGIGVLKPGVVITPDLEDKFSTCFKLWVLYFGGVMNENGYMKDNRDLPI